MKELIKEKLLSVQRNGIDKLVQYLEYKGYFTAPASTKYHGAYEGALVKHCYSVEQLFRQLLNDFNITISEDSIIICSYLHDMCKVGAYIKQDDIYRWNNAHPKGHCKLSIDMIEEFIDLTEEEKAIIGYHMGMYGTMEFNMKNGEYSIAELSNTFNKFKVVKLFYFCDDMSANFLED